MSLDWNLEDIKDWETVTRTEDGTMNPVTHALIMSTMGVGMGSITEANADEFAWRLDLYQHWFGALLVDVEDGEFTAHVVSPAEVRQHIGLHTNVSLETRARWLKRMSEDHYREFTRNNREKERA